MLVHGEMNTGDKYSQAALIVTRMVTFVDVKEYIFSIRIVVWVNKEHQSL